MLRYAWVAMTAFTLYPMPAFSQDKKNVPDKEETSWTFVSASGKKLDARNPRFLAGTRRLTWLASEKDGEKKSKADLGPECFEFRETNSTLYADGILTLVPILSVVEIAYDDKKQLIRLTHRGEGGKTIALHGTIRFKGINKCLVEADAGLQPFGAPTVRFHGGLLKGGFASLLLSGSGTVDPLPGPAVVFVANDKERSEHHVVDPLPLYRATKVTSPKKHLQVRKGDKVASLAIADIAGLRHLPAKSKKDSPFRFEVALKDGTRENVVLLKDSPKGANPPWTFLGFIGRVPSGWKLLPAHTIHQATWPQTKKSND